MIDISGFQQSPDAIRVPTCEQIAVVLGRLCRYAGQLPCTVLTHTLVGARVLWEEAKREDLSKWWREQTWAWWILHDVHECITGDIVHKNNEVRSWQEKIDDAVAAEFGVDGACVDLEMVKRVDLQMRWLEAKFYGAGAFLQRFKRTNAYIRPSPGTESVARPLFSSPLGDMLRCVMGSNRYLHLSTPVAMLRMILEQMRAGMLREAIGAYWDQLEEMGLGKGR
jgi:hypothetical protein